jgi:hypothetical protein
MQRWLRWLLIILTVGGGFCGLVLGLPSLLFAARADSHRLIEAGVFAPVYVYALYLGLRLAEGHKPIGGLVFYFALQIPWIDCSDFSYRFYSGLLVSLLFAPDGQRWLAAAGFLNQLIFSPGLPFCVGINIMAVLIVFALILSEIPLPPSEEV